MRVRGMVVAVLGLVAAVFGFFSVSALAAIVPVVTIKAPAGVSATTALLSGTVDPNGSLTTTSWGFQYSKDVEAEGWTVSGVAGTALAAGEVSGVLEGLQPDATYVVRLVASNEEGGEGVSAEPNPTFKTLPAPPLVAGESAPGVKGTEARVEGTVNPNNEITECRVQYGTVSVTEHEVPCEPEALKGYGEDPVAANLTGLAPNTVYEYRVLAESEQSRKEGKPATGPTELFTTKISPEAPETLKATGVTGTTARLEGVLNPHSKGEAGTYTFVYRQSTTECQGSGEASTPENPSVGETPEPVSEEATILLANTTYTYCLRAVNSVGEVALGAPQSFTTPAVAPTLGTESYSSVGSSSAKLHAQVNPGGIPTSFFFEYGPSTAYGSRTPLQSAGAGAETVSVLANLEGLAPDTEYHFRVVVENTKGEVKGNDESFSTFPVSPLGLPDGRGYEIVSPLENGNATVLPGAPTRAAADGSAVAYVGTAPPNAGNGSSAGGAGIRPTGTNVYVAKRSTTTTGGWSATDIEPPGIGTETAGFPAYEGFSSDLSVGFLSSPQALNEGEPSGQAIYSHENGVFQLLAPGAQYKGSTPDGTHALYSTSNGLYEYTAGASYLISYLPNGTPYTPPSTEPAMIATFGSAEGDLEHTISNDGTQAIWTIAEPIINEGGELSGYDTKALYLRKNTTMPQSPIGPHGECTVPADACTIQLDASQVPGNESGGGVFQTANTNSTKIFFTDCHHLTTNSTTITTPTCSTYHNEGGGKGKILPAGADLYEYDVENGMLSDLTSETDSPGEHADVAGVLGASEDGTYIYFAAAGALANGATPKACEPLEEVERAPAKTVVPKELRNRAKDCNLYVIHAGERPRLIASLAHSDGFGGAPPSGIALFRKGDWLANRGAHLAQVSPDGLHLVFVSIEDLTTGFESEGNREVYIYDFGGGVSCVSCNPSGTPTVLESFSVESKGKTPVELPVSLSGVFALRVLSGDGGRVFFESTEGLVGGVSDVEAPGPEYPGATEGKGLDNVYEWERGGEGSCGRVRGCLFLLSGGTSGDLSFFVDASESGDDVFIGSRAQLVPEDHGEVFEVYDARVGATTPPTSSACTSTGCQGVPSSPPSFATPSSVTFDGIGNFPAPVVVKPLSVKCKKGLVKKSNKCVKPKRKKKMKAKKKTRNGKAKKSGRGSVSDRGVGSRS